MATSTTGSSSTSSSTSTSTSTSKSSKCTGSSQHCEKPSDSTNTTAVVVAVVVPVVVVGLVLIFILYKVYKRNKKEELEDNDPDFDGDAEFLPDFGQEFEMERNVDPSGMRIPSSATRAFSVQPNPFNDETKSFAYSQSATNPFQLPTVTDDSETLRNFAKTFQNSDFDGYKLATRSASQISISRPTSAAGGSVPNNANIQLSNLSKFSTVSNGNNSNGDDKILKYSEIVQDSGSPADEDDDDDEEDDAAKPYGTSGTVARQNLNHMTSIDDDDVVDDSKDSDLYSEPSPVKYSRGNVTQSYIHQDQEGFQPEVSMQESERTSEGIKLQKKPFLENEDDVYIQRDEEDSDEDVARMKSIYQVYLDRNGTVKTIREGNPVPEGFQPVAELPKDASNIITESSNSNEPTIPSKIPENYQAQPQHEYYQNGYSLQPEAPLYPEENYGRGAQADGIAQSQDTAAFENPNSNAPNQYSDSAPRVASSIYDTQSQYHNDHQQNQYYYNHQYYGQNQYDGSFPTYHNQIQHNLPPPNMESIEELPRPSNLPFSGSSHSLTSFKSKTTLKSPAAAAMTPQNNHNYNPIDHPELYFHQTNGSDLGLSSDQASSNTAPSQINSAGSKVLPHHLRQSVVMTNPNELSQNNLFKPAGSFSRAVADSRSNSLMSNTNTYQQQLQDNYIKSRVSGILDDTDVMHPPSMGTILPHSGSQDDLRKQLGSSHNYNVM
ncbi:Skg6/Tos2 [Kluyveromyces lactis]|nr:Skg6/Tos2 [Kluyveromyces lactis]